MLVLLQRVLHADVVIDQQTVAAIKEGLLALVAFEPEDTQLNIEKLFNKVIRYRVFSDSKDKMNHSLVDIQAELLIVPQFTLAANTQRGLRPSFSSAAAPEEGEKLFSLLCEYAANTYSRCQFGQFAADMHINLCNNGPVTFLLSQN